MERRDIANLSKNIYDDSTLDTLRALDSNLITLMSRNPDFKNVQINRYERVPLKPNSPQSQIRVDVSREGRKGFFFLSDDLMTRLEGNDIHHELLEVMKKIKTALQPN